MSTKIEGYKVPKYCKRGKHVRGPRQITKIWLVWQYFKTCTDTARGCAEATGINESTVRCCINTLLDNCKMVCLYSRHEPHSIRKVKRYTSNRKTIYNF